MKELQLFMHLYMYELEIWLNNHVDEVLKISFQSDEANPDRPLKEYLKSVIENRCNGISNFSNIQKLVICYDANEEVEFEISETIKAITIERVLLPEDITPQIKDLLQQRKNAVYTNPDLCLELNINGNKYFETIELKSTTTDAIPGSSVQQVTPDEWVIFVKHRNSQAQISTGKYLHAVNSRMQFPDRSPRPQVSFDTLKNWNNRYRTSDENTVKYHFCDNDYLKYELLNDWQDFLAKRWVNIVFSNNTNRNEPWFNNNLRKFVLKFLNEYDAMSSLEQTKYKELLKNIIV